MRQPIQLKAKARSGACARQITFSIFASGVLLASGAVATPVLGNYPNTALPLSADTTVTPDAAPSDTTKMNVSTRRTLKARWKAIQQPVRYG